MKKILLFVFLLLLILRELDVIQLNWVKTEATTVSSSYLSSLEEFHDVSKVIVINEYNESKYYNINNGTRVVKISVQDRFSDWPLSYLFPFYKFGESNHRIYYKVESQKGTEEWFTWPSVYKFSKVKGFASGICSIIHYKKNVIRNASELSEKQFEFLKGK